MGDNLAWGGGGGVIYFVTPDNVLIFFEFWEFFAFYIFLHFGAFLAEFWAIFRRILA